MELSASEMSKRVQLDLRLLLGTAVGAVRPCWNGHNEQDMTVAIGTFVGLPEVGLDQTRKQRNIGMPR